jgi:SAM-dependent methyltransferase
MQRRLGLVRCCDCRLRFINPRPDTATLTAFYRGRGHDYHNAETSLSAGARGELLIDRIEQAMPTDVPRRMLDYGCGGGGFVRQAAARGWDARGYEPDPRGADACRRAGLEFAGSLDDLPPATFGVVTLHHVFEHLENPAAALAEVRRLLAPGGMVFIEVPNVGSLRARLSWPFLSRRFGVDERHRAFPIHLSYFSPRTLGGLLRRAGWAVERRFTLGLGIEELFCRAEEPAPATAAAPEPALAPIPISTPRPTPTPARHGGGRLRFVKSAVKAMILGTGLGENLCVLARPVSPAAQPAAGAFVRALQKPTSHQHRPATAIAAPRGLERGL